MEPDSMSRRDFASRSLAACVAVAAGVDVVQAASASSESDVEIRTSAGVCDAALIQPQGKGPWPAAILYPDVYGLRPTMREMARRLASDGYVVLVPNFFYRSVKAPGIGKDFDFQNPADRARLAALRAPLTNEGVQQDALAFTAFLDGQGGVNKKARVGTFGYCMGGRMALQAAAGVPERIGAAASFHGGGLVTDQPDSTHLLVPKMKGRFYLGIAASDDQAQPDAKTKLTAAFSAAHLPAKIEVYEGTLHGWCVKDMPPRDGKPVYDEAQAERAWKELLALFKTALV